jgi:hypothetical protein
MHQTKAVVLPDHLGPGPDQRCNGRRHHSRKNCDEVEVLEYFSVEIHRSDPPPPVLIEADPDRGLNTLKERTTLTASICIWRAPKSPSKASLKTMIGMSVRRAGVSPLTLAAPFPNSISTGRSFLTASPKTVPRAAAQSRVTRCRRTLDR